MLRGEVRAAAGRLFAAALVMSMTACGGSGATPGSGTAPGSSHASIWFHPLPTASDGGPPGLGSTDFRALFLPNSPWQNALAHTSVFGVYAGWVTAASDAELQQAVAFFNAHHLTLEIEAPALQATATCGSGVEGFVDYGMSLHDVTLAYLQRLQALGAQVSSIKVDEPYFFGSVTGDPRSCHYPVREVARQVAQYALLAQSVYPNVQVGDVEPVIASAYAPDVVTALRQWHDAYAEAAAKPFPFYFADIDFSNPAWPSLVKSLEADTRSDGLRFGIIYIGDPDDTSDAEWTSKVVRRFQTYEGPSGGRPDYALFQSWEAHPKLCLPESDPTTFTGAIDAYVGFSAPTLQSLRARTH
jgi:hypothetical protein